MDDDSNDSSSECRIPYFRLLNTLANDLDYMLNDLYTSPPSTMRMSGDAFLEPYMQGISNDVHHATNFDEVLNDSCNVLKKRLQDEYPANDDRSSSFPSPVTSLDTPLDERTETHFRLIAGSQGSLNQLISGDECSESTSETSSLAGDEETSCDITLVERLIRSHPIWFLPGILRAGAFHLLQGKEDGNFVVRQSSQNSTMAISVRLPSGRGPYIEHYLIQAYDDGQIGLESSDNKFSSIPLLIAHYCQCCDELPVQLTLPRAIREAKNRQQLTSLALLGQEFWRYPMANPRQSLKSENESPVSLPSVSVRDSNAPISNTPFLNSSSSNSPASSLSSFESSNTNNNMNSSSSALDQSNSVFDVDSSILMEESSPHSNGLMTTFKGSSPFSSVPYNQIGIPVTPESPSSLPVESSQSQIMSLRRRRPTPPNTLNLASTTSSTITKTIDNRSDNNSPSLIQLVTPSSKTPPPPPPRWTKPTVANGTSSSSNFTVTTTVTFCVDKETSSSSDPRTPSFQVSSSERTEKHIMHSTTLTASMPAIAPTPLPRFHIPLVTSPTSPSPTSQILSPVSEGNTRPFHRRPRRHKESHHYQESNVVESYHRSTVADKASDYEDIWGPENGLSTFKPQPPPRSFPFSSLDDFSLKNVPKKTSRSASPTPDNAEPPLSLPDSGCSSSNAANKNRFGLVFSPPGGDPSSLVPISVIAATPTTPSVAEPQTPVSSVATPAEPKIGSPFYAEPADAIKQQAALKRRVKPATNAPQPSARNRHSDPTLPHQWPPSISDGGSVLERIDSKEELITNNSFSSSVDNLVTFRNSRRKSGGNSAAVKNIKPIDPPKVNPARVRGGTEIWAVDPNWEFIGKETNADDDLKSGSPKNIPKDADATAEEPKIKSIMPSARTLTIQEMIFQRLPGLRLSPVFNNTNLTETAQKNAETDDLNCSNASSNQTNDSNNNSNNSEKIYHNGLSVLSQISDTSDDTQTEFSEPWDSSQWEHLLSDDSHTQVNRCKSFKERLDPLLSPPRVKALSRTREENSTPGSTVRSYAMKLAADKETVFAKAIENFISCTKESRETRPQVVMRNMRQFMSGMKNYLVTHGEREFNKEVENERNRLKSTEFLNLDAILEGVMHKLVVTPLRQHLCDLFVRAFEENGSIKALVENIVYARTKTPFDLGLKRKLELPTNDDLQEIATLFLELQAADSPLYKLECLLKAISTIFNSVKRYNPILNGGLGADDFLPIFVWVLVQTGLISAEIEAEYMWGLLHPSLLSGEGGYYLTTLSSAVNVLKNFRQFSNDDAVSETPMEPWPFTYVFKVLIPNELNGSLLTKTLPVRPNMTTREICRIIALKLRITNPQDYALYQLVEGEESPLNESDYPQDIKTQHVQKGKRCLFAYKRTDAKIAWPN